MLNDLENLLLIETPESSGPRLITENTPASLLCGPGDNKSCHEGANYQTRSKDLTKRPGNQFDLMSLVTQTPLGLPKLAVPSNNPIDKKKISLGRRLFYDRRLSLNETISCAMCHVPEQGFTNNELSMAVGIEGRSVRRNTPTLYNVGYARQLFHDAREDSLEQQVWSPLHAHNEMANPSIGYVVNKIKQLPDYEGLFEAAFSNQSPSMQTIGAALASYQRTLNSGNSVF